MIKSSIVWVPADVARNGDTLEYVMKLHPYWVVEYAMDQLLYDEKLQTYKYEITYSFTNPKWKRNATRRRRAAALGGSL